jgi:hypothetical protein
VEFPFVSTLLGKELFEKGVIFWGMIVSHNSTWFIWWLFCVGGPIVILLLFTVVLSITVGLWWNLRLFIFGGEKLFEQGHTKNWGSIPGRSKKVFLSSQYPYWL